MIEMGSPMQSTRMNAAMEAPFGSNGLAGILVMGSTTKFIIVQTKTP